MCLLSFVSEVGVRVTSLSCRAGEQRLKNNSKNLSYFKKVVKTAQWVMTLADKPVLAWWK